MARLKIVTKKEFYLVDYIKLRNEGFEILKPVTERERQGTESSNVGNTEHSTANVQAECVEKRRFRNTEARRLNVLMSEVDDK